MVVRKRIAGLALWALVGFAWGVPSPNASLGNPAPVWRFDGSDFYLVDRTSTPGLRSLSFLQEGDAPDNCSRRLTLRKVACKDLYAYEKRYTSGWNMDQRDVTYRSAQRLCHSGWTQKGDLLVWHLMNWEMRDGALICSEFELLSRPPCSDAKAMNELVLRQHPRWNLQLKEMMKQAPVLLEFR